MRSNGSSLNWQDKIIHLYTKIVSGKRYGYEVLFKHQDKRSTGKTGVIIADVGIPEEYEYDFYGAFMAHVFHYVLPPFLRRIVLADRGISLIDPERPLEREKFTPKQLIDCRGSFTNKHGIPYVDCAHKWKPPLKNNKWDHGYFLYTGDGPNGFPDICDKVGAKIVGWYYGKLIPENRVSYRAQMQAIYDETVNRLTRKFPGVEFRNAHYMDRNSMQDAVMDLINKGCETIIYQSINCTLYSDFEDYGFALPMLHKFATNRARVILADQLGNQAACRDAYLAILKNRLIEIPVEKKVLVILSKHGHPFKNETMDLRADIYRHSLELGVREMMKNWQGQWDLIWSSDEYVNDKQIKKQLNLDTYSAYRKAIEDGYDYALEIPTEFIAENTDQMIFHGMKKFSAFAEYDRFLPIPYPDWNYPLIRRFTEGRTTGIYCGTPVGPYRKYMVQAAVDSISEVL